MLEELHIRNYAIIEDVRMKFDSQLNVIIGETGAGKSILMGALNLVLGKRADRHVLLNKDEKCIVEAIVNIRNHHLKGFFESHDLDYQDETIIRREINIQGKSRAFINDTPCNLTVLKSLAAKLIDIHEQEETNLLLEEDFFINILDAASKHQQLDEYQENFKRYKKAKEELKDYKEQALEFVKEYDFIRFQYDELDQAHLEANDWEEIEKEINTLSNAEAIINSAENSLALLSEGEYNVENLLGEIQKLLIPLADINQEIQEASSEIENIQLTIGQLIRNLRGTLNQIDINEERLEEITNFQSIVNRLLQKHQLKSIDELIQLYHDLGNQINQYSFSEEHILELEKEVEAQHKLLVDLGKEISLARKNHALPLEKSVIKTLQELGMPHAQIKINFEPLQEPNRYGTDKINLLFSPNKGSQLLPLTQIGSGGEKSRLMLAIKSQIAKVIALPTLIFDEIDSGISGEVAIKTGELLKRISSAHQVIAITHLPQVAAAGKHHFHVHKEHLKDKTITQITPLHGEQVVMEIAKMLSGSSPTQAAIDNARNLIEG